MFPKKIKTRSFRKIVFRGTRGVTSDGAQERVRQLHVSTAWMPSFLAFSVPMDGWKHKPVFLALHLQVLEGNCFVFSMLRQFCITLFPNRLVLKEYHYLTVILLFPGLWFSFSAILVGSCKSLLTRGCVGSPLIWVKVC